jgi:hypothetical protein
MPHNSEYDLVKTTHRLLDVLDTYNVKAVFFVVGKIIEEYPNLVKEIFEHGHEIGIHGYAHEHIERLTKEDLTTFSNNLYRIELSLERLTGKRPVGFRSPYLTGPKFYMPGLYKILEEHKYKWVSNRELRYPEELFRPDRLGFPFLSGKNNWYTNILFVLLNLRLLFTETIHDNSGFFRIRKNLQWLNNGTKPFKRGRLMEVPLYSPLDCDLLGYPKPENRSPDTWIKYAVACLVGGLGRNRKHYMLNFHDWIIGTSNRVSILENTLKLLRSDKNSKFIIATDLGNQLLNIYE